MSRLNTFPSVDTAPAAAQATLNAVGKALGVVPNLFRTVANSPSALKGYTGLSAASGEGTLSKQTLERIALAVSEVNGCGYCLSAHTYLARNVAKLDDVEISANRNGRSNDIKADAAVRFAVQVTQARGHVVDADLAAVKAAGFSDGEVVEIVLAVALNTFTNYLNEVAGTELDFPVVTAIRTAA
ncbi:MAG: peroxidase-related enzyme [Betaproteobacteria bacterium]|nr:peroxidase-related enzyme [Betaproteobacteria bacterium]